MTIRVKDTSPEGRSVRQRLSWYRGEGTSYYPSLAELRTPKDAPATVLKGWLPPAPFIRKNTPVAAFGSCFAVNIVAYLITKGYTALGHDKESGWAPTMCNVSVVNTATILQQLQWAWNGVETREDVWYTGPGSSAPSDEKARASTRKILDWAEVFVITLGLSEVWYSKASGEIFWKAVPGELYDPKKHGFRVLEFEENLSNLRAILALIREKKPASPVIVTVSPIPLKATFRPVSTVTANVASKAVLRAAVDRFVREADDPLLYYWPSYELVTHCWHTPWKEDGRHIRPEILETIMRLFHRYYLVGAWK